MNNAGVSKVVLTYVGLAPGYNASVAKYQIPTTIPVRFLNKTVLSIAHLVIVNRFRLRYIGRPIQSDQIGRIFVGWVIVCFG
jgi:hypothetical protein